MPLIDRLIKFLSTPHRKTVTTVATREKLHRVRGRKIREQREKTQKWIKKSCRLKETWPLRTSLPNAHWSLIVLRPIDGHLAALEFIFT